MIFPWNFPVSNISTTSSIFDIKIIIKNDKTPATFSKIILGWHLNLLSIISTPSYKLLPDFELLFISSNFLLFWLIDISLILFFNDSAIKSALSSSKKDIFISPPAVVTFVSNLWRH